MELRILNKAELERLYNTEMKRAFPPNELKPLKSMEDMRDSGWDRLAALIFGLVSIAPAVGIVLAWVVWFLSRRYANK